MAIGLWKTSATVDTGILKRYDRSSSRRFSLNLISVRSRLSDGDTLVLDEVRLIWTTGREEKPNDEIPLMTTGRYKI